MPTRRSRRRRLLTTSLVLLVLAGVGVAALSLRKGVGPLPDPEGCEARVGGVSVTLDTEQAQNASIIAGVAVRRGLPARAASIALATAFQESKLRNLDHGDRDSLGLFQQRPSQGWGTSNQIRDPYYAAGRFYDELRKVHGYQAMRITEAAQKVQRSGYPEAYEDHAADARALASALTGYSHASFSCVVHGSVRDVPSQRMAADGLTPRAEQVRSELRRVFGSLPLGGYAAGGVSTGHQAGSAHYEGRAIDVFVRPVSADNKRKGWAIASYLVAQADRLSIDTVIFDDKIWKVGSRSADGWETYEVPSGSPGDQAVLEHRDHVHVDVAR